MQAESRYQNGLGFPIGLVLAMLHSSPKPLLHEAVEQSPAEIEGLLWEDEP